ncbi:hypothetical protein ACFX5Q_05435 [Mesorhizobium sp. IMUNJ 23033]|uniref:hypothetical protein n=1 Tax=Mesorhizobium sp. IMUNJ 23033 TaxID=3378039 RepID=UPI003850954D
MAVAELFLDRQAKVDAERAEAVRTVSAKETLIPAWCRRVICDARNRAVFIEV